MRLIRHGDRGPAVAEVRAVLCANGLLPAVNGTGPSDVFDQACELAVRAFQQHRGLSVDGIVGRETYQAISEARWRLGDRVLRYTVNHHLIGDDVAALQVRLLELGYDVGRADGVFAARTEHSLRGFQRDYGLRPDGTCGPATMRALKQLGRHVVGGRPHLLRESALAAAAGPNLLGKRIVIDPGHGGRESGGYVAGIREADVVWDLATRLEGRVGVFGVATYLTRGPGNCPSDLDRAELANDTGADLLLSLHTDAHPCEKATGVATYHFGATSYSAAAAGERLAGLVHREVVARTGLVDCRTHAKRWDLLRMTRMPAIRLELGYLTNTADRAKLADPGFRDVVAEALVVAIQRMYLPIEADPPTGTYEMPTAAP